MSGPATDSSDIQILSVDEIIKLRRAAEPASLDDLSVVVSSSFEEDIARAQQQLKERIAKNIMQFMGVSLIVTLILTLGLAGVDGWFIHDDIIQPTERLITENVVITVIGATVVQVGTASIAIVYSLFGRPKGDEGE